MAVKQELEIHISETGDISINVLGAKGKSCIDMTKELEAALGTVVQRDFKTSYYEQKDTYYVQQSTEQM